MPILQFYIYLYLLNHIVSLICSITRYEKGKTDLRHLRHDATEAARQTVSVVSLFRHPVLWCMQMVELLLPCLNYAEVTPKTLLY